MNLKVREQKQLHSTKGSVSTDQVSGCLFPPGPPKWCLWPCQGHHIPAVTGYCNTALVPACVTTPSCRPTKHPKVKVNYPCKRSHQPQKVQGRYFPNEHKLPFDNKFNLFGFMCLNATADLITTTDNVFQKLIHKSVLTPSFKKKPLRMLHLLNFWEDLLMAKQPSYLQDHLSTLSQMTTGIL